MHPQANIFSILAFYGWIPIALWGARRWPSAKAASLLFLVPVLFLPELMTFKLPGIPQFGKLQLAIFWLLVGVLLFHRPRLAALRLSKWIKLAISLMVVGLIFTALLNPDPVSMGSVYRMGHTPYDAVHFVISSALGTILPFILAAAIFNGPKALRVLFRVFVAAALVYSVLQIVELRLSPQLHRWVYGYHHSYFLQAKRGGGFRPMVFMYHGLAVAMFTSVAVMAAAALYKAGVRVVRVSAGWVTAYLWLILLLSKSAAAFLYSALAVPLILFFTPKTQFRVAVFLAIMVLGYPFARGADLVPVEGIMEVMTAQFGEERAESLMVRFRNEEKLLERAGERYFFGWGGYCRPCIFESESGKQVSLRDGDWIITMGNWGLVGFLGKYLLLLLPIFMAARQRKRVPRESDRRLLSALALMVACSMVDLLPNGTFNYLTAMLSGALYGCSSGTVLEAARQGRLKRQRAIARQSVERTPVGAVPLRKSF